MARKKSYKNAKQKRDGAGFLAIPHVVLKSKAYRNLSYSARSLLIDIAYQYKGENNGSFVACKKYLKPLGWNSNATVTKGLQELQEARLLQQTRLGMRPNRASWYAVTWQALDNLKGMDISPQEFDRGGYNHTY